MSLACDRYQEQASALADGRLEPAGIATLQGHLRVCPECRLFMSGIYRARDLLRAEEAREPAFPVSSGFAAGVAARVAKERVFPVAEAVTGRPSGGVSFFGRFVGAAAAAAVLLTAGWSSYRLASVTQERAVVASTAVSQEGGEETMATYFREYALQSMDSTLLGPPQGVELADFETLEGDVK